MPASLKIFIPLDSAAIALGADDVAEALSIEGRRRGLSLSIVRTGSRGMHWLEPLVEFEREGERHGFGPVAADDAPAILDAIMAETANPSTYLGPVEEIPFLKSQTRITFARCGITDPLSLSDYCGHGGFEGLSKALTMSGQAICEEVMLSGLRGRGGAGFSAGTKWRTVAGADADQKYVVCNADEGDSGAFADRMIMEGDPFLLIEGMVIAGLGVGASKGFIYLRSEYPLAARILEAAIATAHKEGLLGDDILGSGRRFDIELFIGAGSYICGEETALLNSLEGKRGEVRAKPPLPAIRGLFGKPTLVHNVISLCAVPAIVANGGAYYRDFGMGRSTGTMPFQISGNVRRGGLYETAFGVSVRRLVEEIGGGTLSGRPVRAVQIGGPLGAYLPQSLLDLPMDYETMLANAAGVGHGGLVVFDDTVDLLEQARYAFEFCAEESCGKCTPCRIGAVRGVELVERIRDGIEPGENMQVLEDLCELMTYGSLCAMGGMTPVPVRSAIRHFPEDFQAGGSAK